MKRFIVNTQNHFDKIAGEYDESLPEHVQRHYLGKRARLIGRLLNGGEALDVGCGTGRLMEALKPYGKILGVDGSAGMIEVLKSRNRGEAQVAQINHLPFPDGKFDVVYSVAVMHHLVDPALVRQVLAEMHRVTKRGGYLLIWDHNPANPYWPVIMARSPQDCGNERLVPASEIVTALSEYGMESIRVRKSGFVADFFPRFLMKPAATLEFVLEKLPLVNLLAAHNVIIARKRKR